MNPMRGVCANRIAFGQRARNRPHELECVFQGENENVRSLPVRDSRCSKGQRAAPRGPSGAASLGFGPGYPTPLNML